MVTGKDDAQKEFGAFVETIAALRAPDGCPWDREQTHLSIAHNMLEEAYEAVDAIEAGDVAHLREELGDVLLQVVLQSQIAADEGEFTVADVCRDVNEKMIRRHP
ncbi:MAG: nucleoside triphosphate pyrophosphohydrolase, partial [Eggerthellaceae bacterium]|nr:nucleoside triphosphate pyrophosphohydrolase [Eggerthellaceae bacterium]